MADHEHYCCPVCGCLAETNLECSVWLGEVEHKGYCTKCGEIQGIVWIIKYTTNNSNNVTIQKEFNSKKELFDFACKEPAIYEIIEVIKLDSNYLEELNNYKRRMTLKNEV